MSSQNLSYTQMAMYMPAHEIAKLPMTDTHRGETNKDVLARKLKSAKADEWEESKGMYKSIKKIGVQEPVEIIHDPVRGPMLGEGHHRIASAMDVNPNMVVPVKNIEPHEKNSIFGILNG
jgi:hypothetical protein